MRIEPTTFLALALAGSLLQGCMGGAGAIVAASQEQHASDRVEDDYSYLLIEGRRLSAEIGGNQPRRAADIPASGQADLRGVLAGDAFRRGKLRFGLAGVADLSVDFDDRNSPIHGSVSDLARSDGKRLSGELRISDGNIRRDRWAGDDYAVEANLSGEVSTGSFEKYRARLRIEASFRGQGNLAILGTVGGKVTSHGRDYAFRGSIVAAE